MPRKPKRGRIVYPSVSDSLRVGRLGVTGALLWLLLIPQCDDQGRVEGDPSKLRERLVPHIEGVSTEDVETALLAMACERLIVRYRSWGKPLVQVVDWWAYNSRLVYKNPSYLPAPNGWRDRVTARARTVDGGGYILQLFEGISVECPNCGTIVTPTPHGLGYVCPKCDVELLGRRNSRPKIGGSQTRVTGKAKRLVLASLAATAPQTKEQLATATGYSISRIGTLLPVLRRAGWIIRVKRKGPYAYRLAVTNG